MPTELQIEVWQYALLAESQDRVVLLHSDDHVIPLRHLNSPFLSTTALSRTQARRFYTVALQVRDVPLVPMTKHYINLNTINQEVQWQPEYNCFIQIHSYRRRGTVYLNPTYDTFITGLDFTMHYAKMPSEAADVRPMAEVLPDRACKQVRNLVLAQRSFQHRDKVGITVRLPAFDGQVGVPDLVLEHTIYSRVDAERRWRRTLFSSCTTFQHLCVGIQRHEICFGDPSEGEDRYTLRGPSACAWALLGELPLIGGRRSEMAICEWRLEENKVAQLGARTWHDYVADPDHLVNGGNRSTMHAVMAIFQGRRRYSSRTVASSTPLPWTFQTPGVWHTS
ncbi:hypothetical protein PG994_002876 [Apiospora phragmitis]|uniref:Uncharacterized protein n=1 Tax=Apiospora phragmitis TaxID=2905665 RepID=A0ABR1WA80_9PEZI